MTVAYDPRTRETLAWLASLPAIERLATMNAMMIAFPIVRRSDDWKRRIDALRTELALDEDCLAAVLARSRMIAERLKRQLE